MSKGLEALKRSFDSWKYLKDYETIEKELEVLDIIRDHIAYIHALNDRTKNPDNDLICFEIRGLLDKETWSKIYEVLGAPIL